MMPSLKRQGAVSAVIQVVGQLAIALLGVATARYLGAAGFGIFAACISLMRVSMIVAEFGMPVLVVRECVRLSERKDWALLKGLLIFSSAVALGLSTVLGAFVGVAILFFAADMGEGFRSAILSVLILVPIAAILRLYSASLRGMGRILYGQIYELILAPLLVLVVVLALMWDVGSGLPEEVLGIYSVSYLIAASLCAVMIWRTFPRGKGSSQPKFHPREWLRGGGNFVLAGGAIAFNTQVDIIVLSLFHPSDQVGYYKGAVQTAFLSSFVVQVMYTVCSPRFAALYGGGEYSRLWRIYRMARNYGAFGVLVVLFIFFFIGGEVLELAFGQGFGAGKNALVVLCVGMLLSALAGPNEALLSMTGGEKSLSRIVMLGVLVNVLLNFCLIPYAGILGASIATALSATVTKVMLLREVRRVIPNG